MLVFIDESGLPLPFDSCTRPTLCAVCIPKETHRTVTGVIFNIKKRVYGVPSDPSQLIEIKANKLLVRRVFREAEAGIASAIKKVDLLNAIIDACESIFSFIRVYAVVMHRPPAVPTYPPQHLEKENIALLQRVDSLMGQRYVNSNRMASIIFDEKDINGDMKRAYAFSQYMFTSPRGRSCSETILDTPLFVASEHSPGIQLADLLAGAIRIYYESRIEQQTSLGAFETAVSKLHAYAKSKTDDFSDGNGNTNFGFYEMPISAFPIPSSARRRP